MQVESPGPEVVQNLQITGALRLPCAFPSPAHSSCLPYTQAVIRATASNGSSSRLGAALLAGGTVKIQTPQSEWPSPLKYFRIGPTGWATVEPQAHGSPVPEDHLRANHFSWGRSLEVAGSAVPRQGGAQPPRPTFGSAGNVSVRHRTPGPGLHARKRISLLPITFCHHVPETPCLPLRSPWRPKGPLVRPKFLQIDHGGPSTNDEVNRVCIARACSRDEAWWIQALHVDEDAIAQRGKVRGQAFPPSLINEMEVPASFATCVDIDM